MAAKAALPAMVVMPGLPDLPAMAAITARVSWELRELREAMSSTDGMPRALPAMWRALKRGYEAEPLLLSVAFGLSLLAALPDALLALWLKFLAGGGRRGRVTAAALGLGASAAASWFLRVISDRTQRRFRDRVTVALEAHVARLQASVASLEHHEGPR